MDKYKALEQLLTELEDFLKILDKENLSSTAVVKKSFLADLLRLCTKSNGGDEEYIYMNKVTINKQQSEPEKADKVPSFRDFLTNGEVEQHLSPPQKSLPDLPPSKIIPETKPHSGPKTDSPEGYYEEAEPYGVSVNGLYGRLAATGSRPGLQVTEGVIYATITMDDGEAVSSSYESYDEEESSKGKSAPHQWPSPEASIELMKDARICAFLWRKKWLGQWAKQLCVIKDNRLLCYKTSKDHNPQLDVNLLGCSVIHKEKNVKKKEHKLKIIPMNADVIVLGLQSKDQAEQWLRVIQETSGLYSDGLREGNQYVPDSQRFCYPKLEPAERYSGASESGSSTDGHIELTETKDAKKKGTSGLKLSNLMHLGRKKSASLDSPEKSLDTCTYLNVLVNSQWRSRWCHVKDGQLHFYQDKNRSKTAQQPLNLLGCEIVPDPSPDHLYSFRILHNGDERAMLEAKSCEEMGHWLGLLLSESGSKTDPEELTYDYVDADRVSCIVSAAKNSFLLMQRKFSEPNMYIDNLPKGQEEEELYDDVDVPEATVEELIPNESKHEGEQDRTYLDLTPISSFMHCGGKKLGQLSPSLSPSLQRATQKSSADCEKEVSVLPKEADSRRRSMETPDQKSLDADDLQPPPPRATMVKIQTQQQQIAFPQGGPEIKDISTVVTAPKEKVEQPKLVNAVPVETKLGKNRTEAEVKRYSEEKDRLEKEKEEIRSELAQLRKEKRELKEMLINCTDKSLLSSLKQKLKEVEEECKRKEDHRVDLELSLVEVKENLRKAESGPVTLGTAVDTTHLENASPKIQMKAASAMNNTETSPVNSAMALKNRPLSVMVTKKGMVLQKTKEWEKKGAS
ncbi:actin filament-associated protein 1-like 2 isoform X4 [Varanus komodoensis]|uniref:actin filament-associated protein 1-like 2 isoform X4 n=1 Tax=Varanus komodoensis TaxID=61221 RepID=UPI001CF7C066|nr:actin filament-associated protein 1-like 2 isoform X4 [Varanus komodoensis]